MRKSVLIFIIIVCLFFAVSCNDGADGLFLSAATSVESSGVKITSLLESESDECWILTNDGIVSINLNSREAKMVLDKAEVNFQSATKIGETIYLIENNPEDPEKNNKLRKYDVFGKQDKSFISDIMFSFLTENGFAVEYKKDSGKSVLYFLTENSTPETAIHEICTIDRVLLTSEAFILVKEADSNTTAIYENNGTVVATGLPYGDFIGFQSINNGESFITLDTEKFLTSITKKGSEFSAEEETPKIQYSVSSTVKAESFYDNKNNVAVFKTYNGFTVVNPDFSLILLVEKGFAAKAKSAGEISGIQPIGNSQYIMATATSGVFILDLSAFIAVEQSGKTASENATLTLELTDSVNVYR